MVPRTVLTRSGLISLNTARPVNTVQPRIAVNNAGPMKNVINNAYSTARRPFNKIIAANNSNFTKKIHIIKGTRIIIARPKAVLNTVKGNKGNVVKASACCVWRPKHKVLDHGNPQQDLKDKGVIENRCSRHMTGNRSYLTEYEEIDGGFVAFGGNSNRGKITGKDNIKTGKLDFKDVLKLTDESHVLLKVLRKDNMYSVDLKKVVPQGGLTCLFVKATPDESNLWHRRLRHLNFKTMNKLVRGNLVRGIENLIHLRVKMIRCDNGTEFKNRDMNQFYEMKGIKREFSVARTPQQNGVAERKNRTLIEVARTMLANSKLPTTFWAKVVNTVCYVQNRVLVIKPYNKTPYELFLGRKPTLSFMRPFGYPVTILNTIYHQGKFIRKADDGFFVGYSTNSKAFRVFNSRTRIVEENMHVQFSENTSNIAGSRPNWLFDIDALTNSINDKPVVARKQSNGNAGIKACDDAGKARVETVLGKDYILLPLWTQDLPFSTSLKNYPNAGFKPLGGKKKKDVYDPGNESENPPERKNSEVPSIEEPRINQEKDTSVNSTNNINTISPTVNAASIEGNAVDENIVYGCADDPNIPDLEEIGRFSDAEDDGVEAAMTNSNTDILVSPILTTIIHKDHPIEQIIRDIHLASQTRSLIKSVTEHAMFSSAQQRTNHKNFQNCLSSYNRFGPWWIYHMAKGPLVQNGCTGTRIMRGIVIRNKARLVSQGYTQEEGIDYDEVFALVTRTEAIRLFLAYALFKDFMVYQMDVKSAFLYEKQKEDRIFISQDKYVIEILKKFGFTDVKTASTPMETQKPLLKDEDGEEVDVHLYRSMIGSLMYLTSSRLDIMFVVYACARYQVNPKVSHLHDVKRIFRYLKGQPKLGLWYRKDSPFDLVAYIDSDYAGEILDIKSTTGVCQFLRCRLISWQCKKQTMVANSTTKAEYVAASSCCGQVLWIQNQLLDDGYNFMHTKIYINKESTICIVKNPVFHSKIKHIKIRHHFIRDSNEKKLIQMIKIHIDKNVSDLLTKAFDKGIGVNAGDSMLMLLRINLLLLEKVNAVRHNLLLLALQALVDGKKIVVTEASIRRDLQLEDANGKDFSGRVTPLFSTMMVQAQQEQGEDEAVNEENVSKHSNDPLLSGEDRPKLEELMALCTNIQNTVLDLEHIKTTQALEINSLKRRVKKLKKKQRSRNYGLRRLYKVGLSVRVVSSEDEGLGEEDASKQGRKIHDIDADEDITLENDMAEKEVSTAHPVTTVGEVVTTANVEVSTASPTAATITTVELTLAQILAELKSTRPKTKGVVMQEPSETTTTTTIPSKDKGKGIMVEEPLKIKKKDQVLFDEQEAIRLQAQFDEEERIAREKEKANVALIAQ
ncbi:putative ribonuclease H-like domain-containing protein [Tanacetum coccineum]